MFSSCTHSQALNNSGSGAYIQKQNGKYTFYRNGQPFVVKGGSGYTNLKRLHEAGGNTIRVWDTVNLKSVLDSAQANDIAVVVGLPMPVSDNIDGFYNTPKANAHLLKITQIVKRYKNHPAVLSWCLGNELAFPYKPKYNSFYSLFNGIVDMIHREDPRHPVTTTIMTFQKKNIANIKLRTKIDFISFNIFGSIQSLKSDLKAFKWFWDGPFLITEWGVEGPWINDSQNVWGAYVENTSTKKAEQYLDIYQKYMPLNDPGFLGSLVFYWGQKQECTPTWFSLFDETGHETETVRVMEYLWKGKKTVDSAPSLNYMLLNGQGARDNIMFPPGAVTQSDVVFKGADTTGLTYKWKIFPEDWFKPNGIFREKPQKELKDLIVGQAGPSLRLKTPGKEGPYRLCVYVYNKSGAFATANIPFYVLKNP